MGPALMLRACVGVRVYVLRCVRACAFVVFAVRLCIMYALHVCIMDALYGFGMLEFTLPRCTLGDQNNVAPVREKDTHRARASLGAAGCPLRHASLRMARGG